MSYIKVKKLNSKAKLLTKREEDAWYDLYWIFENNFEILYPWDIVLISTWIAIEIPQNKVFFIAERWSTWTKWIAKRAWIVDSWYRWEIFVSINNTSNKPIVFYNQEEWLEDFLNKNNLKKNNITLYSQNKAIAQGMIFDVHHLEVKEVDELSNSERGKWALWSTNK